MWASEKQELKRYMLLEKFMRPELKGYIIDTSQTLDRKILINEKLIREVAHDVAEEEKSSEEKIVP